MTEERIREIIREEIAKEREATNARWASAREAMNTILGVSAATATRAVELSIQNSRRRRS
jgi:hypothetical protein